MTTQTQAEIDDSNRLFWQQICGSVQARSMRLGGDEAEVIQKYDSWFFGFYPYLDRFIPFKELASKDVLEVGLGYGSVSQRLAESGANFTGLDIANGPVNWVNHRLATFGLPGEAAAGSILEAPFPDKSFDYVVTIGCLHHTGNLQRAINEVHRLLRKGGRATIMIYNASSYYRLLTQPLTTLRYCRSTWHGNVEPLGLDANGRAAFDTMKSGSAPETVVATRTSFDKMLLDFSKCEIVRTNIGAHGPLRLIPRHKAIEWLGPRFGLDLYATVTK